MKVTGFITGFVLSFATLHSTAHGQCIPPNNLDIPVPADLHVAAVKKAQFESVLHQVYAAFKDDFAARGARLVINNLWSSGRVNASAYQEGNTWYIDAYGGLARYPGMTPSAFAVVMCHEVGHHLGGYPTYGGGMKWASAEGQADYFATSQCIRSVSGAVAFSRVIAKLDGYRGVPRLNTPDRTRVTRTNVGYPNAQCRLDTLYNAIRSLSRPRCWFAG